MPMVYHVVCSVDHHHTIYAMANGKQCMGVKMTPESCCQLVALFSLSKTYKI